MEESGSYKQSYSIYYQSKYGEVPKKVCIEEGTVLEEKFLPKLSYEWYVFKGWSLESGGNDRKIVQPGELTVSENIVLYACWVKKTKVSFVSEYGIVPEPVTVEYDVDENWYFSIPKPKIEIENSERQFFNGYLYSDGTRPTQNLEGNLLCLKPDNPEITLYAEWKTGILVHFYEYFEKDPIDLVLPEECYPTYYTDCTYSFSTDSQYYINFFDYAQREGYTVRKFCDNQNFSGNPYKWDKKFTDDCNVYAKWEKVITVTLDPANGEKPKTRRVFEDDYISYRYEIGTGGEFEYSLGSQSGFFPKKSGFSFAGWYKGDTKVEEDIPLMEDVTLVAKYVDPVVLSLVYKNVSENITDCEIEYGPYSLPGEFFIYKHRYSDFEIKDYWSLKISEFKTPCVVRAYKEPLKRNITGIFIDEDCTIECSESLKFNEDVTLYITYEIIQ